ncbi:arginine rich protein [Aspergillus sp. HF37]|nr:arginine rich protein [Aspergillus sp. HF37]
MGDSEEVPDAQSTSAKRPSMDIESLQRKKFKLDELPLTPAQHTSIQSLLHSFKKKGGFDSVRSGTWKEFDNGEHKTDFLKSLTEMADQEIDREPELLSRERRKAATLIEGALDRNDIYKSVEKAVDALASKHLDTILSTVRDIRRQEVGEEVVAQEERSGNKTDEEYEAYVKTKREEREKAHQEAVRKQKEIEEEQERIRAEEKRKRDEEAIARRKEREERRRAEDERIREEQRLMDEQRERERQERYERRRREERERYRDWEDKDRNRSRTRDRDRYRDRSPTYRSDRGLSPRYRDSRRDKSPTPKDPTPAPPPPPADDKSLEEAALQLLLREGEELAAKARQKPEFDFEEAEAAENGAKSAKAVTESKSGSPRREPEQKRRESSYDRKTPSGLENGTLMTNLLFAIIGVTSLVTEASDRVDEARAGPMHEDTIESESKNESKSKSKNENENENENESESGIEGGIEIDTVIEALSVRGTEPMTIVRQGATGTTITEVGTGEIGTDQETVTGIEIGTGTEPVAAVETGIETEIGTELSEVAGTGAETGIERVAETVIVIVTVAVTETEAEIMTAITITDAEATTLALGPAGEIGTGTTIASGKDRILEAPLVQRGTPNLSGVHQASATLTGMYLPGAVEVGHHDGESGRQSRKSARG